MLFLVCSNLQHTKSHRRWYPLTADITIHKGRVLIVLRGITKKKNPNIPKAEFAVGIRCLQHIFLKIMYHKRSKIKWNAYAYWGKDYLEHSKSEKGGKAESSWVSEKTIAQNFPFYSVGNEEPMMVLLAYMVPVLHDFLEPECPFLVSFSGSSSFF